MLFNPIKARFNSFSEGMLRWLLDTQYDPSLPMGNFANSHLDDVIRAWLVGLQREIAPLIPRSLQWIDKALERNEIFGADINAYRGTLYRAKAIGRWLEDGVDSEGDWDAARVYEEIKWRHEKYPWSTNEIIKHGLDDYIAFAYQGGAHNDGFQAGIEMYERWTGKSGPISLSKLLKPREFGYALCLYRTCQQQFDEEELFKAGRRMLQENLQETWLGGGQMIRAATWLKIVYWHYDESLTPLQTILKAYDNMPKVSKPGFVTPV